MKLQPMFLRISHTALFALALLVSGHLMASWLGLDAARILAPLYMAVIFYALDGMPGRLKGVLMLAAFAAYAHQVQH